MACQKAPSAKRCIKTVLAGQDPLVEEGQKAPSAKRCIKTVLGAGPLQRTINVRKHRAPKGALRLELRARHAVGRPSSESTERQKVH